MSQIAEYIKKLNEKTPEHEDLKLAVSVRLEASSSFQTRNFSATIWPKKTTFATDILTSAINEAWEAAEQESLENSGDLRRKYDAFTKAAIKVAKKTKKAKKKPTEESKTEGNEDAIEEETE